MDITKTLFQEDAHCLPEGLHPFIAPVLLRQEQVWSFTQFYLFDFIQSRIVVKSVFASVALDDVIGMIHLTAFFASL